MKLTYRGEKILKNHTLSLSLNQIVPEANLTSELFQLHESIMLGNYLNLFKIGFLLHAGNHSVRKGK